MKTYKLGAFVLSFVMAIAMANAFPASATEGEGSGGNAPKTANPEVVTLGDPVAISVVHVRDATSVQTFESQLNKLAETLNMAFIQLDTLQQTQSGLVVKTDGSPLINLMKQAKALLEALEVQVEKAAEKDPVAMAALGELSSKFNRLHNYVLGPDTEMMTVPVVLTNEGRQIVDVKLANGMTVEGRIAVGADRKVTPTVVDFPVAVVVRLPDGMFAFGSGMFIRGEGTVSLRFDPFPMSKKGAEDMLVFNNISKESMNWMCAGPNLHKGKPVPYSVNRYANTR